MDLSKCPKCNGEVKCYPVYFYDNPEKVKYRGWVEDYSGNCIGFIDLDDEFIHIEDLKKK